MYFKTWLEQTISFETDKGSIYRFADSRSSRLKSVHQFHDPNDHGAKQQSDLTIFVQPDLAREIGMWGTLSSQKKRVVIANNAIMLVSFNPVTNKHGLDKVQAKPTFETQPRIGFCPLELFQRDITPWSWLRPGMQVFAGSHPGSPIVKVG